MLGHVRLLLLGADHPGLIPSLLQPQQRVVQLQRLVHLLREHHRNARARRWPFIQGGASGGEVTLMQTQF